MESMTLLNKIYNIEVILKQANNMEKAHFSENLLDIHRDKMWSMMGSGWMAINKVLAPITTSKIHSTKEIG